MRALLLALLAVPSLALGDVAVWAWTPPTARVDGSALTSAEIKNYRLVWTLNGVAQTAVLIPGGTTSSYTLTTATSGRVCGQLVTIDTDGLESDPTPIVCKKSRPNPPSNWR